jgi:hypothetical protein
MGGVKTSVRATWRIANLTTRDLNGHDPALQFTPGREMPGKDTKGWLGEVQEGRSPSWGAAVGGPWLRSEAKQPLYL